MVREPTDAELNYINQHLSKKTLTAEDIYILNATIANDYRLTLYHYYLGATTLHNFVNDLADTESPQKFLINHRENIPLGTWLQGLMKKENDGYAVEAPVYMLKGLEAGGYGTDEIVKAYQGGHLTDVSVYWVDGEPICDICGLDIRDPECSHIPGFEYDGVIATCTIENGHLGGEISGVWKGALPGAKFKGKMSSKGDKGAKEKPLDWKDIKKAGWVGQLSHMLTVPIQSKIEPKEENMTYEEMKAKFADELAKEFIFITKHEEIIDKIKEQHNSLVEKTDALKGEKEKLEGDLKEMTDKYAEVIVELEDKRQIAEIGKTHLDNLIKEYHRLGVALHEEKWDMEAKTTQLNALNNEEKFKFLETEIVILTEGLNAKLNPVPHSKIKGKEKQPYTHTDNDELYKTR